MRRQKVQVVGKEWMVGFLLLPLLAWADQEQPSDIRGWLDSIAAASRDHSYVGTFVYHCNTQIVAMKIVHAVNSDGEREKLVSLSGPSQKVINADRSVLSVLSRRSQRAGDAPVDTTVPDVAERLGKYYEVSVHGEDRIAERDTTVLAISPRDEYRYGFLLWLDKQTHVVLRSDMLDEHGSVIEQMMFTDIRFVGAQEAVSLLGEEGKDTLSEASENGGSRAYAQTATEQSATETRWHVPDLPDGFVLTEHYVRESQHHQPAHEQLIFSDGLASVSIFIERHDDESTPFRGATRMGAVNAYGNVLDGYQVTVVGDVPSTTVQRIGMSVSDRQTAVGAGSQH